MATKAKPQPKISAAAIIPPAPKKEEKAKTVEQIADEVQSVRLTSLLRDIFVKNVMNDVPFKSHKEAVQKILTEAVLKTWPKGLAENYEKYSDLFKREIIYGLDGESFVVPRPIDLDVSWFYCSNEAHLDKFKLTAANKKKVLKLVEEHNNAYKDHRDLKRRLQSQVNACQTTKQLAQVFPEFVRYLPKKETPAKKEYAVSANLMQDFVKAGWPKGGKPDQKA